MLFRSVAGTEIPWTYIEESPEKSSRAYVRESTGRAGGFHLHGLVAVGIQFATLTITYTDADDSDWALATWRSLKHLIPRDNQPGTK